MIKPPLLASLATTVYVCPLETAFSASFQTVAARASFNERSKKPVLIVVHDELDLPIGKYKFSFAKNDAGHNGVKSIIKKIRTKDFYRFRIGVGSKEKINDKAKYVLSEFNKNAKDDLDKVFLNFKHSKSLMSPVPPN